MTKTLNTKAFSKQNHSIIFESMVRENSTLYKSTLQYSFINHLYNKYENNESKLFALKSWIEHVNEMKTPISKDGKDLSEQVGLVDAIYIYNTAREAAVKLSDGYKYGYIDNLFYAEQSHYTIEIRGYQLSVCCDIAHYGHTTFEKLKEAETLEEQIKIIKDDILEVEKENDRLINGEHLINLTPYQFNVKKFSESRDEWITLHEINVSEIEAIIDGKTDYTFTLPENLTENEWKIIRESRELSRFMESEMTELVKEKAVGVNKVLFKKLVGIFKPVMF